MERDPDNPRIAEARSALIPVVVGDASFPETLRRVGIERARELVSLAGSASHNAAVATAATTASRAPGLRSLIEIDDPHVLAYLQRRALTTGGTGPEFFSLHERAAMGIAQRFVAEHGLHGCTLVICGAGPVAQHLVARLARERTADLASILYSDRERRGLPPLAIHLVVANESDVAEFDDELGHPSASVLGVHPHVVEDARLAAQLASGLREVHPSEIVVTDSNPNRRVLLNVALDGLLWLRGVPRINVVGKERHHLDDLANVPGPAGRLNLIDEICQPESIRHGRIEDLARSIHSNYLRVVQGVRNRLEGVTLEDRRRTVQVPWPLLSPDIKRGNVDAAHALLSYLEAVGLTVVPLRDLAVAGTPLDEEIVRALAPKEHERWRQTRFGAEASGHARNVRWEDAADDDHTLTWEQLRATNAVLASAGYQIDSMDDYLPESVDTIDVPAIVETARRR